MYVMAAHVGFGHSSFSDTGRDNLYKAEQRKVTFYTSDKVSSITILAVFPLIFYFTMLKFCSMLLLFLALSLSHSKAFTECSAKGI